MAKRVRKPVLFIRVPRHMDYQTVETMLRKWEARRDYHFLLVESEVPELDMKEFGSVTANGSDMRRLKEEILELLKRGG